MSRDAMRFDATVMIKSFHIRLSNIVVYLGLECVVHESVRADSATLIKRYWFAFDGKPSGRPLGQGNRRHSGLRSLQVVRMVLAIAW